MRRRIALSILFCWFFAPCNRADSNISPTHSLSWSPALGWVNWRGDGGFGLKVGHFVCSGFIYSANVGWINCGSGLPANGMYYSNTGSDFGVNVDEAGAMRGFAYGANIGWIQFENLGNPRIDLATGMLSGQAYSANIGWLSLGDASYYVQASSIDPGADTDHDGIPDAWEIKYAGNLTRFNATSDSDGDGATDLEEYLAGTDTLNAADVLRISNVAVSQDRSTMTISWLAKTSCQYFLETRSREDSGVPWQDSGLGAIVPTRPSISESIPTHGVPILFFRIRATRLN